MKLGLSGKSALLMSSTRGLGFGCAKALTAEGVSVVINGRDQARGIDAASELGDAAKFIAADVTKEQDRQSLHEIATEHLGAIDILITNCDGPSPGSFLGKTIEEWRQAFDHVAIPSIDMVHRCVPSMTERRFGRVVNISSISAKETTLGAPLANGLRPVLLGAFGTLAREIGASGVTINNILAGPFDTDVVRRVAAHAIGQPDLTPEEATKIYAQKGPMKRLGTIEEFGALCAFLSSDLAGYITGQSFVIDGGHVPSLY